VSGQDFAPTFEEVRDLPDPEPKVRLKPLQRHHQQDEQCVSTEADTLHCTMEDLSTSTDVKEEELKENPRDIVGG
jgi:hypothetical protein